MFDRLLRTAWSWTGDARLLVVTETTSKNRRSVDKRIERLGVVDLGTNSIRVDIYEIKGSQHRRIYRDKQMIRLGEEVFLSGKIEAESLKAALKALSSFNQVFEKHKVTSVTAFATCALREAKNKRRVLKVLKQESGFDFQIISGEWEAKLIAQGILKSQKLPPGRFALIDIGGGSTELSLGYGKVVRKSVSFPLGALRLEKTMLHSQPPTKVAIAKLRSYVKEVLHSTLEITKELHPDYILGSSGTIRTIKKMLKINDFDTEPFDLESLRWLVNTVVPLSSPEILDLKGVTEKRADILLSGAIILEEMIQYLEVNQVFTTDYSMRDGILNWVLSENP